MAYSLPDLRGQSMARFPEVMLKNLRGDFPFRFSVGIWYFTPGGGRFHDRFVPKRLWRSDWRWRLGWPIWE